MRPNHADTVLETVLETVQSRSGAASSRLAASWRRSLIKHGLDPAHSAAPERMTASALSERHARLEPLMMVVAPRMDQLYGLVGNSGCSVMLTDADGVVLDQRCSDADAPLFQQWGLWSGAIWSEEAEGTNGIGTCLAEIRQVIIHRDEHFLSRNTAMRSLARSILVPKWVVRQWTKYWLGRPSSRIAGLTEDQGNHDRCEGNRHDASDNDRHHGPGGDICARHSADYMGPRAATLPLPKRIAAGGTGEGFLRNLAAAFGTCRQRHVNPRQ